MKHDITFEELMNLNAMCGAHIISGANKTNKKIAWSHIIELDDIKDWIHKDTLVIVTGVAFLNYEKSLIRIITIMKEQDAFGLLVAIGLFIPEIPETVRALSNQYQLPIIVIPKENRIVDITYQIAEKIFREENEIPFPADQSAMKQLTRLHSNITGKEELYQTLCTYLEQGGNMSNAARILFIHRNTMKYRIKRLEEIMQCDLRDENTCFQLKCVIKMQNNL